MKATDLVGMTLYHNVFGDCAVLSVEDDRMKIQLRDRVAFFSIDSLNKFFKDAPTIDVCENEAIEIPQPVTSKEVLMDYCSMDDNGKELSVEDWENSKAFILDFWWQVNRTPTPVVSDNKKVYISAASACSDLGISKYSDSIIYSVCNGSDSRTTYAGHKWRFAKELDIDNVIQQLWKTT